jgi:hypothetical protein
LVTTMSSIPSPDMSARPEAARIRAGVDVDALAQGAGAVAAQERRGSRILVGDHDVQVPVPRDVADRDRLRVRSDRVVDRIGEAAAAGPSRTDNESEL